VPFQIEYILTLSSISIDIIEAPNARYI